MFVFVLECLWRGVVRNRTFGTRGETWKLRLPEAASTFVIRAWERQRRPSKQHHQHIPPLSAPQATWTLPLTSFPHHVHLIDMSTAHLHGLVLTKSERILVIAFSYLFCAPIIYNGARRLLAYLLATSAEARRQVRTEQQRRQARGRRGTQEEQR